MTRNKSERISSRLLKFSVVGVVLVMLSALPNYARADQGGYSFWLPGQFGSLAAAPGVPGWSWAQIYYHTSVGASGGVAAARQIQIGRLPTNVNVSLNADLKAQGDVVLLAPSYTFATPVFGGQLAVGVTGAVGRLSAEVNGTLTTAIGPLVATRTGSIGDSSAYSDLYPLATLKWNAGVHNFMTYIQGNIPVGDYDPNRLSNIGLGHAAIDSGGGYTYFNPATGHEFSAVAGFTYNFKNPDFDYRNGVDFHIDWGASQFLSKQLFIGLVGYAYQQISDDSGAHPLLGGFRSRVFGVGPQLGYLFPIGDMQGYLNIKAYGEFAAANRPEGWNAWLTFAISPMAPPSTMTPTRRTLK